MQIVCKYDTDLERFLIDVVQYTLNLYAVELNLSRLRLIELKHISEFEIPKDGSTCENGTIIIVTSRLYDMLPNYDIEKLEDSVEFQNIVNTLYHEMGHVTDWITYPNLYEIAESGNEYKRVLPAFFWLEYIAEKRSCQVAGLDNKDFCEQFIQSKWHSYKLNLSSADTSNFYYLNKVLSYFLPRISDKNVRTYYLDRLNNALLVEYIEKLIEEIGRLEKLLPFDDIDILENLYEIMNEYYKKFKHAYTPLQNSFSWFHPRVQ